MSPSQSSANSNVSAVLTKSMHDHWGLYLGEGIVLILLGLAAIIFPFIAGIVVFHCRRYFDDHPCHRPSP